MAVFEWDVTSITSVTTTLAAATARGRHFYGTLFGIAGTWIELPANAPPIDDITLSVALINGNDGLYFVRGTSTQGTGMYSNHASSRITRTGLEVAGFQRGGRWIRLDRAATAFPLKLTVGSAKKRLVLHYRSVNDVRSGIPPTA